MSFEQRLAELRSRSTHNPHAQLAHVKPLLGLVPGFPMFVHDPAECRYISRSLLRAGTWELLARADVPVGAVITEYVDVAHAFYERREAGFVNGLLDGIARQVRG